jgi:prolyl-tRNA synthetase
VAPFEAAVLTGPAVSEEESMEVYDLLSRYAEKGLQTVDAVLDDRVGKSLGWKMKDADLIGYPVVVVMGRGWKDKRELEVQCRRLGVKKDVGLGQLREEVEALLAQL